jgi:hypothetical protein
MKTPEKTMYYDGGGGLGVNILFLAAKARGRRADDIANHAAPEMRRLWASGRWRSLTRRPHEGGAQNRLGEGGRDNDESSAKAQTRLDRSATTGMWEIEGISVEDGWHIGGRADGMAGQLGNLIVDAKLGLWMQLVDTFPCYPGPRMLYEIVPEGGDSLIPVWEASGWSVLSELHGL